MRLPLVIDGATVGQRNQLELEDLGWKAGLNPIAGYFLVQMFQIYPIFIEQFFSMEKNELYFTGWQNLLVTFGNFLR